MTAKTRLQKVLALALIACLFVSITLTVGAALSEAGSIVPTGTSAVTPTDTDPTTPTDTDPTVPTETDPTTPTDTDPTEPTTEEPTTAEPTTAEPTTAEPTTAEPTTEEPTTEGGILGWFKDLINKIVDFFTNLFEEVFGGAIC